MRRLFLALSLLASPLFAQSTFDLQGYVAARGINATGPPSWLEAGWGRLNASGDTDTFQAVAQLGVDWHPSKYFDVHVSGAARHDPDQFGGEDAGLVEAYADARAVFGLDEVQLRAGQFFLPTSRENQDELWTSPYTIGYSALNAWIGEEVRPVGVDLQWLNTLNNGHVLTTGATAFRGNDTMGALLAWRGWSVGSRLGMYDEIVPLPGFAKLHRFFPDQIDGTKPFGDDLDGNTGFAARARYSVPQRGSVQYTWLDNRGDRRLHDGEYAWATRFHLLGAEIGDPDNLVFAAEYMKGKTGMGDRTTSAFVDADFYAAYALLSEKRGRHRWTARYDLFNTEDKDESLAEYNEEKGRSWTLAWMYDLYTNVRVALELTQFSADRPNTPDPDARSYTAEVRYRF